MTYLDAYKGYAKNNETLEGDEIDNQVAHFREHLVAGKVNFPYLRQLHDLLGADLRKEITSPLEIVPHAALRAARRYMAIHTVLAMPGAF